MWIMYWSTPSWYLKGHRTKLKQVQIFQIIVAISIYFVNILNALKEAVADWKSLIKPIQNNKTSVWLFENYISTNIQPDARIRINTYYKFYDNGLAYIQYEMQNMIFLTTFKIILVLRDFGRLLLPWQQSYNCEVFIVIMALNKP